MLSPSASPRTHRRISAGAAAGVYAEKQGYVDTGVAHYSSFAAQNGLPTPEIVLSAVPDTKEVRRRGLPPHHGGVPGPRGAGSRVRPQALPRFHPVGASLGALRARRRRRGARAVAPGCETGSSSSSSALPYLAFLAGAGTGAAVYYYGPDKCKAYVEKCVERVHERVRESPAAAKAWAKGLDPATRLKDLSPTFRRRWTRRRRR